MGNKKLKEFNNAPHRLLKNFWWWSGIHSGISIVQIIQFLYICQPDPALILQRDNRTVLSFLIWISSASIFKRIIALHVGICRVFQRNLAPVAQTCNSQLRWYLSFVPSLDLLFELWAKPWLKLNAQLQFDSHNITMTNTAIYNMTASDRAIIGLYVPSDV